MGFCSEWCCRGEENVFLSLKEIRMASLDEGDFFSVNQHFVFWVDEAEQSSIEDLASTQNSGSSSRSPTRVPNSVVPPPSEPLVWFNKVRAAFGNTFRLTGEREPRNLTESLERVADFLNDRLTPISNACDVRGELEGLVKSSWMFVAREIFTTDLPEERLWSKRFLYVHRKPRLREDGRRDYRIGVTDDPHRRNAVKKSEDSDYRPYFDLCAPLCDSVEAAIQTLLLPFAKRAHDTNRRASCFVLSDELALRLCLFLCDFYRCLVLRDDRKSPEFDEATVVANRDGLETPSPVVEREPVPVEHNRDPRFAYFQAGKCAERNCEKLVPLHKSRKTCPLHSSLRKLQGRIRRLRERRKKILSQHQSALQKMSLLLSTPNSAQKASSQTTTTTTTRSPLKQNSRLRATRVPHTCQVQEGSLGTNKKKPNKNKLGRRNKT